MKGKASFDAFSALDIRTGTVVKVEESKTTKPTWRMTIDLGPELGMKVSCGATRTMRLRPWKALSSSAS